MNLLFVNIFNKESLSLSDKFKDAFKALLTDTSVDEAFLSYALLLPGQMEINDKLEIHRYEDVLKAIGFVKSELSHSFKDEFITRYHSLTQDGFKLDAKSMGQRSLKNLCLSYIANTKTTEALSLCGTQFDNASNMTDEIMSLKAIVDNFPNDKSHYLANFYKKWKGETLVMQKWISVQAMSSTTSISELKEIEKLEIYDAKVPNIVRSLLRSFIRGNPALLNNTDGSGYKYLVDKIIDIDKFNPSLASGLTKTLNHLKKLDPVRRNLLEGELNRLLMEKLSNDTYEVATKNLKG